ncbi:MAG: hypothetical protein WBB28_01990 [Crinalium sp.]
MFSLPSESAPIKPITLFTALRCPPKTSGMHYITYVKWDEAFEIEQIYLRSLEKEATLPIPPKLPCGYWMEYRTEWQDVWIELYRKARKAIEEKEFEVVDTVHQDIELLNSLDIRIGGLWESRPQGEDWLSSTPNIKQYHEWVELREANQELENTTAMDIYENLSEHSIWRSPVVQFKLKDGSVVLSTDDVDLNSIPVSDIAKVSIPVVSNWKTYPQHWRATVKD